MVRGKSERIHFAESSGLEPDCSVTFFGFFNMCDLGACFTFHFGTKKIMESSIIFLQNGVLILDWKENKEAGAICFEIRIPRKKGKELLRKVNNLWNYFIMEKNKNIFWFVNNSEYHHRKMGLTLIFSIKSTVLMPFRQY